MKIIIILIVFGFFYSPVFAQTDPAKHLAQKSAQKMKDTLGLTAQDKNLIKNINISLAEQKRVVWERYLASDSLTFFLQRIENKRDTLYSAVLPANKYLLYKQKKRNLINNN